MALRTEWRVRLSLASAYRHAMARHGEPVLRLVLGLGRVHVEVEHQVM